MSLKVLITPRSITAAGGHPALAALQEAGLELIFSSAGRQPSEQELAALLPGCVGYLAGAEPIGPTALTGADQLRVISRNGVGIDRIDTQALAVRGIELRVADGANARGVAELTIGLLFALTRTIAEADREIKAGRWTRRPGMEVFGKTIGLVGFGRIGQEVAKLASAMGMNVLAYDPQLDPQTVDSLAMLVDFKNLLRESDVVSFHCPAPANGVAMLNRDSIACLKPGSFVINTARSALIDEEAILEAIEQGQIAGLALDVFDQEPPPLSPLITHQRVVTTCHQGGLTEESVQRAVSRAVEQLLECLPELISAKGVQ